MKTLASLVALLCITFAASAQWMTATPMNDDRFGLDAVEHNGNIYVIGGMDGSTTLERYTAGTWTYLPDLPTGQGHLCAALVGDKIYTFGGYGPLDTIQIYDIYSATWSTCPVDLPIPLYWATAEAVGNLVYVIGGYTVPGGSLSSVYILNTTTNTWSTGTSCPVTLQGCTSVVYNGYIWVFHDNGDYKYDYINDSWTAIAPRPYLTKGATAEVINDAIYVMGGFYGYIYYAEPYTQIYDTAANYWTLGPDMIFARYQLASGYVDDYLYTIGGRDPNGGAQDWVERLYVMGPPQQIELDMWTQSPTIPAGGGTLFYGANVTNNTANLLVRSAWTYIHLPSGGFYGPLMTRTVNLPPGTVTAPNLTETVPGYAPAGEYTFHGYIGYFGPWMVHATDTFFFTKLTTGPGNVEQWSASDWEFASSEGGTTVEFPLEFAVESAYPNPFNSSTAIRVSLPDAALLKVSVFNTNGRKVAVLAEGSYSAGEHRLSFDASSLASGLYFIHATVPGHLNQVQKVMLVR